jgi:antitoxin component YwqK of YwqJK toxin-antitoxin module
MTHHFQRGTLIALGVALASFPFTIGAQAQPSQGTSRPQAIDRPLDAENAWPKGVFKEDYNLVDGDELRHGLWIRVYGDGSLYYKGEYEHGNPIGSWWYFRKNGTALSHIVHRDDPQFSDATMFAPNGQITAKGGYIHEPLALPRDISNAPPSTPERHGVWHLFSAKGALTTTVQYDRGQKHGLQERFLPSGAVCERGNHVQGEMDGEWQAWHDNGLLRQRVTYRQGTLDGPFQAFYGDGGRMSDGNYLDGAEEGSWKFYLEDGRLQHIHRYRNGTLLETIRVNGTFTEWHGEERPASEHTYRNKMLDGPFQEWHDQGGFVLETFTDPDTGEQLQRRVMKGVQLKREGEYVQGKLDGEVYHYNEQGRLVLTEHFNMDVLERTEEH